MVFQPDLAKLSLTAYRELLRHQNLLPSRRMLLEGLEEKFARLQALEIHTVAALLRALSTFAKVESTAAAAGIPVNYLKVLKREAGALLPKPIPLRDFPGLPPEQLAALETEGIQTSKAYCEAGRKPGGELYSLCNLARINGVGANAAKLLFDAGYRSPADVAAATAEAMLAQIAADNAAHRYYQGTLGLKDVQFCIDMATLLEHCCRQTNTY